MSCHLYRLGPLFCWLSVRLFLEQDQSFFIGLYFQQVKTLLRFFCKDWIRIQSYSAEPLEAPIYKHLLIKSRTTYLIIKTNTKSGVIHLWQREFTNNIQNLMCVCCMRACMLCIYVTSNMWTLQNYTKMFSHWSLYGATTKNNIKHGYFFLRCFSSIMKTNFNHCKCLLYVYVTAKSIIICLWGRELLSVIGKLPFPFSSSTVIEIEEAQRSRNISKHFNKLNTIFFISHLPRTKQISSSE